MYGVQLLRTGKSDVERRRELRDEFVEGLLRIDAQRSHDRVELDHVDAPLAAFDQGDERLRPVEALAQLGL